MITVKLAPAVFLARFPTPYTLAATFLRFQERYESRRFRGRVFTLEQFMDWYAATFGNFTYYQDWSGFNVPSTALLPFYAGRFDPLMEKERRFLARFARERPPFYVIGVASDATAADLRHELAHALFFIEPAYRRAVRAAMRGHDTSALARAIVDAGYHPRVVTDEVHAYLIAGARALNPAAARRLAPLARELRRIFRRHAAGPLAVLARRRAGTRKWRAR